MKVVAAVVDGIRSLLGKPEEPSVSRWYVLDKELDNAGEDEFHHASVVDTLERFIRDFPEPPYTVAIYGRWGQGKSTVARLLMNRLKDDSKYRVVPDPVSLWHYPPEELPRVLNAVLVDRSDDESVCPQPNARTTFTKTLSGPDLWNRLKREVFLLPAALTPAVIVAVAMVFFYWPVALVGYLVTVGSTAPVEMPSRWGLIEVLRKFAWGPIVAGLVAYAFGRLRSMEVTRTLEPLSRPSEFVDDFKRRTQGLRPVVVLDDLDRLSAPKMVKALEAVKAYLSHQKAIFIIPCDDEVLRRNVETVKHLDEPDGEHFLDKFFQHTIRLPVHKRRQMKAYALTLWEKGHHPFVTNGSEHALSSETVDALLDILIHPSIETPRQVKHILNEFSTGYLLCMDREIRGLIIPAGLTRDSLPLVAKLAVLRADYPHFFGSLCAEQTLLQSMNRALSEGVTLETHEVHSVSPFVVGTEYGEPAVGKVADSVVRRNQTLVRFLLFTRHISEDRLRSFLYLRNDQIGDRMRSAHLESLEQDLYTGNERAFRTAFANASGHEEELISFLCDALEDAPQGLRLTRSLELVVAVVDMVKAHPTAVRKLANLVTARYDEADPRPVFGDPQKFFILMEAAGDTLTRAAIIRSHVSSALEPTRGASELMPWATAVLQFAEVIAEDNLVDLGRELVERVGATDLVETLSNLTFGRTLMAIVGDRVFLDVCQEVNESDVSDSWVVTLQGMVGPCVELFPESAVEGLSSFVTSSSSSIRGFGFDLVERSGLSEQRHQIRSLIITTLEEAQAWKDTEAVKQWLGFLRSKVDGDRGILDDQVLGLLTKVLVSGWRNADATVVATARSEVVLLLTLLGAASSRDVLRALVQEITSVAGPSERLKQLTSAMAELLPGMSDEIRAELTAALDTHAGSIHDSGRATVGAELLRALAQSQEGRQLLSTRLQGYLGHVCTENWSWEARRIFGVELVQSIRKVTPDLVPQAITQLGSALLHQSGNQYQWKLGSRLLKAFGSTLIKVEQAFAWLHGRYPNLPDLDARSWALEAMGYLLSKHQQHSGTWHNWYAELSRHSIVYTLPAAHSAHAALTTQALSETLSQCRDDEKLWSQAMNAWGARGKAVTQVEVLVADLEAATNVLGSMADLLKHWQQTMPRERQQSLAAACFSKALEVRSKDRPLWLQMAARLREGAGLSTFSGQVQVVTRLLALPHGEVLEILNDLSAAYPEAPRDDKPEVEGALTSFADESKTERELRGAVVFSRSIFGRLPSSVKSNVVDRARYLLREASSDERRALSTLLGELDATKGTRHQSGDK